MSRPNRRPIWCVTLIAVLVWIAPGRASGGQPTDPALAQAAKKGIEYLRATQYPDGTWDGPIEGDASLAGLHLLMMRYLRRVDPIVESELARYIRSTRNERGGWSLYPGAPSSLDPTVICYAALKASGASVDDPVIAGARAEIARLGGLACTSVLPRVQLALLGQIPLKAIPYVTPKFVSLPEWFHPNIYDLSLARLALVPLALLGKLKAVRPLPPERGVQELITSPIDWSLKPETPPEIEQLILQLDSRAKGFFHLPPRLVTWLNKMKDRLKTKVTWGALGAVSAVSRVIDRLFPDPAADRKAMEWIIARQERDGTVSGVFPATMLSLMALDNGADGKYAAQVEKGLAGVNAWLVHDPRGYYQQYMMARGLPTAYALQTLLEAGVPKDDPGVVAATNWLADHQAKVPGDWQRRVEGTVEPGGWYFGVAADQYPDVDCTVTVLQALIPVRHLCDAAFRKGINWVLAMEDRDGGWAAWDRNNRERLFMSSEAVMPGVSDLRDEDITARTLFVLGPLMGTSYDSDGRITRATRRGIEFLWRTQKPDGSWYGHWAVNYGYGTAQALQGFARAKVDLKAPRVRKAIDWLNSVQNPDGGWGESKESYRTGKFEPGPSDPALTSFVLQGLIAADGSSTPAVKRGLDYLVRTQEPDGTWEDRVWAGVVIPRIAYVKYYLVPTCSSVISILRNWGAYEETYLPITRASTRAREPGKRQLR
ncbi:MAG: hypothetical protein HY815_12205 [Candidatus Riflebacteria bacterium]|nr:hypothetical protein [Candidatus Riflebacteria bacterium]